MRLPPLRWRRWLRSVVLPEPRNPASTTTGICGGLAARSEGTFVLGCDPGPGLGWLTVRPLSRRRVHRLTAQCTYED
jgi:hypothetical protein